MCGKYILSHFCDFQTSKFVISPQICPCIQAFFSKHAPSSTPSSYCSDYRAIKDTGASYWTKYTLCSAVQWCRLFRFQLREMSALRQAKCGYLVWIPKMRNHQLFLRERQEAIFAHIQGNWKSSKAMKVYSFADKQRFRQTVQNFSPNVHFAPNLMKGDPDQSFKSFKILINLNI